MREAGLNRADRASIKIQAVMRRCLAIRRVQKIMHRIASAVCIQSCARRMLSRRTTSDLMRLQRVANDDKWQQNQIRLDRWWEARTLALESPHLPSSSSSSSSSSSAAALSSFPPSAEGAGGPRLVIHLPSISAAEYLRLDMQNLQAVQNAHIACLHQVCVYVCVCVCVRM